MTNDFGYERAAVTAAASWRDGRLIGLLERWFERRRQRHALWQLSDSMLKDIGITRAEAWGESRKWLWQR